MTQFDKVKDGNSESGICWSGCKYSSSIIPFFRKINQSSNHLSMGWNHLCIVSNSITHLAYWWFLFMKINGLVLNLYSIVVVCVILIYVLKSRKKKKKIVLHLYLFKSSHGSMLLHLYNQQICFSAISG